MKLFGFILLALGFICSALVAVIDKETVNWALFVPAMAVGVIGVVILRVSIEKHKKSSIFVLISADHRVTLNLSAL